MFLPHSEKEKLRHLDRVDASEFSEDYKRDMNALRSRIYSGTLKTNRFFSGASLARLLELLVEYANNGPYPQIPSVWSSLSMIQRQDGVSESTKFYVSEFEKVIQENSGWLDSQKFESVHQELEKKSFKLLFDFLFGLENDYDIAQASLQVKKLFFLNQKNKIFSLHK